MDPESNKAQAAKRTIGGGTLALVGAVFVLAGAAAFSSMRQGDAQPPASSGVTSSNDLAGLAQGRFDQGDYPGAVTAYRSAVKANPDKASAWSALGEALVMASKSDPLPSVALSAFHRALALDAKDPRARYFLGVKQDLDGDHQGAIASWLALLAETPPGAPWEADLTRTITQVAKINHIDVSSRIAALKRPALEPALAQSGPRALAAIPGPTAQDLQAAGSVPRNEQRAMAEGMVARLEAKLQASPRNVDGWIMLMRSRVTLNQGDKATAALAKAVAANPADAERLRQEAGVLGVR